jgi:hypothetical protein
LPSKLGSAESNFTCSFNVATMKVIASKCSLRSPDVS